MNIHTGLEIGGGDFSPGLAGVVRLRTPACSACTVGTFHRDFNWRNRPVARAKCLAETPETPQTLQDPAIPGFPRASKPRHCPGANLPGT